MTGDPRSNVLYKPGWVPREHTVSLAAGTSFDAVRVCGRLAQDVAGAVESAAAFGPGPIVWNQFDEEMWFLVPAGATDGTKWPPGVAVFGGSRPGPVTVPALWGNTYPLRWWSRPTQGAPLVDVDALATVLRRITGWSPLRVSDAE